MNKEKREDQYGTEHQFLSYGVEWDDEFECYRGLIRFIHPDTKEYGHIQIDERDAYRIADWIKMQTAIKERKEKDNV